MIRVKIDGEWVVFSWFSDSVNNPEVSVDLLTEVADVEKENGNIIAAEILMEEVAYRVA
jgi:hypothetical protein